MAIRTNVTTTLDDISSSWIFEYYCGLNQKLHGQDIKIKSLWNTKDSIPSMSIHYCTTKKTYRFNDFSSGKFGDSIDLVRNLFDLSVKNAMGRIIRDFNNRENLEKVEQEVIAESRYKVTSHTKRKWNQLDAAFWMQFEIGSDELKEHNVIALQKYSMTKEINGEMHEIEIKSQHIYGYFRNDGVLYKVYQPKNANKKFLKVTSYIQGSDQLNYNKSTLVICSSLKDLMDLKKMKFDLEAVAPDSENVMIPKNVLGTYLHKYDNVLTLFDNDEPGRNSMMRYQDQYGIPAIHLNLEKDLSDSVRRHGLNKVKSYLEPLLKF